MSPAVTLKNHSFANLDELIYEHLDWTVNVDFDESKLRAKAEYTIKNQGKTSHVVLDTFHLTIHKALVDGKQVGFVTEKTDSVFGTPLVIPIAKDTRKIAIEYSTTKQCGALQWLPKEQTASKLHPYLFTQCQAIHARSLVPCPDTPSCKFTYSATVTTPEWCTSLMSAIEDPAKPVSKKADGSNEAHFVQEVPIPAYLLALVAGRLESKELGPRSRVWGEPNVVAKAAHDFSQTEEFLKHAEEIMDQEYVWKRYDLVCLPPSFPYGGMENPCLTFVTPTLLTGDRSNADVVAHEIAHSWTGNLVTNHTWQDFWLNEGWTMWLQRKIMAKIHKDPMFYDLDAVIGVRALMESVEGFGKDHPYTNLVVVADNVDPDDVFSSIPYEKGFSFLHYLSTVVGSQVFEGFARAYIKQFRYKTVTSHGFRDFFIAYFTKTVNKSKEIQQIEWDNWYNTPGMPHVMCKYDDTLTSKAIRLANSFCRINEPSEWKQVTNDLVAKWPVILQVLLLDTVIVQQLESKSAPFTKEHIDAINSFCGKCFANSPNTEIRFRWCTIGLRANDDRQFVNAAALLREQGRMKFVRPLYKDLTKAAGRKYAMDVFAQMEDNYHPIASKMIQKDFNDHAGSYCCKSLCWLAQAASNRKVLGGVALAAGVALTAALVARRRR